MNLLVTGIISTRLLYARRQLAQSLPELSKGIVRQYTGVITILIESALPLSVFGLAYATTRLAYMTAESDSMRDKFNTAGHVTSILYYTFAVSKPTAEQINHLMTIHRLCHRK